MQFCNLFLSVTHMIHNATFSYPHVISNFKGYLIVMFIVKTEHLSVKRRHCFALEYEWKGHVHLLPSQYVDIHSLRRLNINLEI